MNINDLSFSIIIPVYNRPGEVDELLKSLTRQSYKHFEIVIIEDGSDIPCEEIIHRYQDELDISYYYKQNTGPGDSRNFGMKEAKGNYFVIFDSDCLIPTHYMAEVKQKLTEEFVHCYGGPDSAHPSFSTLQKAINYTMTSFLTTGGIRGRKDSLTRFQPRSFNMGLSKEIFEKTGGFGNIHPGEDPDLSLRIWNLGYDTRLLENAYVFHKRRISLPKFYKQVYKFGKVRPILNKWHPSSKRFIFWLPTLFMVFVIASIALTFLIGMEALLPLLIYLSILFADALYQTRNLDVAGISVIVLLTQFCGYGLGYLHSGIEVSLLGKDPQAVFPELFFQHVAQEEE